MTLGLLLIDKPASWTSHDVVAKIRAATGVRAIGHAGTLDPLATGLLILLVGRDATAQQAAFQRLEKTYEAAVTLGARSATDDAEGPIEPTPDAKPPRRELIEVALADFRGSFEQIPPRFSAKQVGGVRAYRAARKGRVLALEPVRIAVFDLTLLAYEYPHLRFRLRCSSGTYVRAIARDLGEKLGVGGYLSALRRTAVGEFRVEDAVLPADVTSENWPNLLRPSR